MLEALIREDPRNKDYRFSLALAERNIGEAYLLNAERADGQPDDLNQARAYLERARRMAQELEAERLLPKNYTSLPGQLTSMIASVEALRRASAIPR